MRAEMPVRSGRLPVSGLEYAELCREAESSQSLVSRVLRVTVSLAHTVTHSRPYRVRTNAADYCAIPRKDAADYCYCVLLRIHIIITADCCGLLRTAADYCALSAG